MIFCVANPTSVRIARWLYLSIVSMCIYCAVNSRGECSVPGCEYRFMSIFVFFHSLAWAMVVLILRYFKTDFVVFFLFWVLAQAISLFFIWINVHICKAFPSRFLFHQSAVLHCLQPLSKDRVEIILIWQMSPLSIFDTPEWPLAFDSLHT